MSSLAAGPADASRAVDTFYESEAALQLVCSELDALQGTAALDDGGEAAAARQAALVEALPYILRRASEQVVAVLDGLRFGRATLDRALQQGRRRANDGSPVDPDSATAGILAAFDRAHELLSQVDANADTGATEAHDIRKALQAEVFGIVSALRGDEQAAKIANLAGGVMFGAELKLVQARWTLDPRALVGWRDMARSDRESHAPGCPSGGTADPALAQ